MGDIAEPLYKKTKERRKKNVLGHAWATGEFLDCAR